MINILSFLKLKSEWNKSPQKDIIMFSEGNTYTFTNRPVLEKLSKNRVVHYITLDPKDIFYLNPPKNVYSFLIKLDFFGMLFLQTLKAKLFVTTTPGLNSLALKRSMEVDHYSYFMHSPLDVGGYQKNSFDYFDSIVCAGNFQIDSFEQLEKKRNTPLKEKVALGIPYYDEYLPLYTKKTSSGPRAIKTVLVAPSWGGKNFLNILGYDIFQVLLDGGYKVIFRPHPQSFIAEKSLLDKFTIHEKNSNFELNRDISIIPSFEKSDLLMSSFSGVVFDFAYITENPCIIFDFTRDNEGFYDSIDLNRPSFEKTEMYKLGKVLKATDKFDILNIIKELNLDEYEKSIKESKKQIANFGNASEHIANFLLTKV